MSVHWLTRLRATLQAGVVLLLLVLSACDQGAASPTTVPSTATTAAPAATDTTAPTAGATATTPAAGGGKLVVVATITQIRSMAEAVAGDLATVTGIIPPGADPHEFEPKPSDVQTINAAALVLKNGVGMDDWLDKLITNAGGTHVVKTVSAGALIRKGDAAEPAGDPHIWFDVTNAMTMTRNIRDALVQVDGAHAATYQANAAAYLQRLSNLDQYIKTQIATLPQDDRKMVTNHDAFGYYIDRYGLTFAGSIIPSMNTEAQPSAKDVADLIDKIKTEHVKAIFLESSINPQLAQQIGSEAGVKVVDTLYGDSLGDTGTPGATYESMMRYDTDTIVNALK